MDLKEMFEEAKELSYYRHDTSDAIRHGMCVSKLASTVAKSLDMEDDKIHRIAVGGMLHDIGKLQISPYIYGRQEPAMKIEEMRYLRLHASMGSDIVRKQGYEDEIAEMILYHHENYDGSGYPYRLRGEAIPIGARIIRVCDVFVALISDRPYRKAFDTDAALMMVIDEVRHFDMRIFLEFQRLICTSDILEELDQILHEEIPGLKLENE